MLSFIEVSKFEVGQTFYESGYGKSIKFTVITPPLIKNGNELHFTGECENGEVDFMINRKYPHYGHKLSLEAEYLNVEELCKWVCQS